MNAHTPDWERLRAVLPWLALLPEELVERLDIEEFAVPDATALAVVQRTQAALPTAYLMTYSTTYRRPSSEPATGRLHLCRTLRPARLTAKQLAVVQDAERRLAQHRLTLCAYARPLSFRVRWPGGG